MATEIVLGTFAEDATGLMTEWEGGYATIWFGATDPSTGDHYVWDGGTIDIQISDVNDTDGLRDLYYGDQKVESNDNTFFAMYLPPSFLRARMTGSSAGCNVQVRVKPRTA